MPESESGSVVSDSLQPPGISPWNPPDQNTGVGRLFLLQGIFPTEESNQGLLHHRWIPYQLFPKGSPRILEWVTFPFSRGSSQPRNQTGVSCMAGGFFTNQAIRKNPPGEGNGNPLQYCCLGNPMDRGAWQSWTRLSKQTTTTSIPLYIGTASSLSPIDECLVVFRF